VGNAAVEGSMTVDGRDLLDAIDDHTNAIVAEATTARAAEEANAAAIALETSRATTAEEANSTAISTNTNAIVAEATAARAAEQVNTDAIAAIETGIEVDADGNVSLGAGDSSIITIPHLGVTGSAAVGSMNQPGNLDVYGSMTAHGNVALGDEVNFEGTTRARFTVGGAASVTPGLAVMGDSSSVYPAFNVNAAGAVTVDGLGRFQVYAELSNSATFTVDATNNQVEVDGDLAVTRGFDENGNPVEVFAVENVLDEGTGEFIAEVRLEAPLIANGNVALGDDPFDIVTVNGTISGAGLIETSGNVNVGQDLQVVGNAAVQGSMTVDGRDLLDAIDGHTGAIAAETSRATTAEEANNTAISTNTDAIVAEAATARAAEQANFAAIALETSRATTAEDLNSTAILTNTNAIVAEATAARAAEQVNTAAIAAIEIGIEVDADGNVSVGQNLQVAGNATFADAIVHGPGGLDIHGPGGLDVQGPLNANCNVTLGDEPSDIVETSGDVNVGQDLQVAGSAAVGNINNPGNLDVHGVLSVGGPVSGMGGLGVEFLSPGLTVAGSMTVNGTDLLAVIDQLQNAVADLQAQVAVLEQSNN
jgi:hypothetical protein